MVKADDRRDRQRDALLDAAVRAIAARGLAGLKARDLAAEVGCSLGAIYNLVADLDDLVLQVGSRTLTRLDAALGDAAPAEAPGTPAAATDDLVAIGRAYAGFARANPLLWRTLFEHRLPPGTALPDWAQSQQATMFRHVLAPLGVLRPGLPDADLVLLSRTLFAAVHGVVVLSLDEKLPAASRDQLDAQVETLVRLVCAGLAGR